MIKGTSCNSAEEKPFKSPEGALWYGPVRPKLTRHSTSITRRQSASLHGTAQLPHIVPHHRPETKQHHNTAWHTCSEVLSFLTFVLLFSRSTHVDALFQPGTSSRVDVSSFITSIVAHHRMGKLHSRNVGQMKATIDGTKRAH